MASRTSSFRDSIPAPLRSIAVGTGVGFFIGGGFHLIAGTALRFAGRATLTPSVIWNQAGPASVRLAGVFATYTALRGLLREGIGASDSLASALAGGSVVAAVTSGSSSRMDLVRASLTRALGPRFGAIAIPKHLILASAFASGVCTLAGADLLVLKTINLRW